MHTVTIVSAFRDSGWHVDAYAQRVLNLDYPSVQLRFVCVEGDSKDDTWARLQTWALQDERVILIKCDTGKRKYGSVIHPERFAILAQVFNAGMDAVDLEWSDYVMFIPSDIRFTPELLRRLVAHDKDLIAAFVYTGSRFYDIWGFSRNGRNFGGFSPEAATEMYGNEPIEMDTVGCTVLMKAAVLQAGCRYTPEEVDRGLCRMARERGFTIWADPQTRVEHP